MEEVFYFFIFDLEGSEYTALSSKYLGPPKNGEKKYKIKNLVHTIFVMTHRISVQIFRV